MKKIESLNKVCGLEAFTYKLNYSVVKYLTFSDNCELILIECVKGCSIYTYINFLPRQNSISIKPRNKLRQFSHFILHSSIFHALNAAIDCKHTRTFRYKNFNQFQPLLFFLQPKKKLEWVNRRKFVKPLEARNIYKMAYVTVYV